MSTKSVNHAVALVLLLGSLSLSAMAAPIRSRFVT